MYAMKWTDVELRIFELLRDRRYDELIKVCQDLLKAYNSN
jgi:hypothetical protein